MANTLASPTWVTRETALEYVNDITFVAHVNKSLSDEFIQAGAHVGQTVNARLPQRFVATQGQALQLQNLYDQTVPVTLTTQLNVAFGYSSAQFATELDEIRERYVMPAAETLANAADVLLYQSVYKSVYSMIGTPGVTPNNIQTYLNAGVKLTDLSTPMKGRVGILDPLAMVNLAGASSTLFNPSAKIGENYEEGQFGRDQLGVSEWFQDQNRAAHTTGTFTSCTPTVNGANQTGSTIITQAWASGATTLNAGDILTFAGSNSVNPLSYTSTGRLQQFVVTATISDTAGAMTISISPSIITSGQLQTVDASPTNGGAIQVWSAATTNGVLATTITPQSLVYHPDAFAWVTADLPMVSAGAEATRVRSKEYGFALRMVEQYQIATDQNPSRLDMLCGGAPLQPRLAVRVAG
jgi:hypothetical protein